VSEKTCAPFNEDQVASLNAYQVSGLMHPFTCGGNCHAIRLIAALDGWRCASQRCDYRQDWAHEWMTDWSWQNLRRPDEQQPAEATGGEQAQDGADELTLTAIRRRALTASTYAEWHQVGRDVETLAARVAELEGELNELLIADGSVDLMDGSEA